MDGRTPWLVALCNSRGKERHTHRQRERERDLAGCVTWVFFAKKPAVLLICVSFYSWPFLF